MTEIETAVLLAHIEGRLKSIEDGNERIERQTIKTNGRVTALEKWRWIISGGLLLLSVMTGFIFQLLIKYLFK